MQKIWKVAALSTLLISQTVSALPEKHETRRLMLATEDAVDSKNWSEASQYLNQLKALDTDKPVAYQYFRGRVMFEAGHLSDAVTALDSYVTDAGEEGDHYQGALKLITRIEEKQKKQSDAARKSAGKSEPVATIKPAEGDSVKQLQQLYLASSPREALVRHVNSLLNLNAWQSRGDSQVVDANAEPDILFQVSASKSGQLQVQEVRRSSGSAKAQVVRSNFSVYGVNPQIKWDCVEATAACWLYDPRDESRWIKVGPDRDQTKKLSHALGQLIRHLQSL